MRRKRMSCEERQNKKRNGHQHKTYAGEDKPGGVENKKGSQGTGILGKIRNHAEE